MPLCSVAQVSDALAAREKNLYKYIDLNCWFCLIMDGGKLLLAIALVLFLVWFFFLRKKTPNNPYAPPNPIDPPAPEPQKPVLVDGKPIVPWPPSMGQRYMPSKPYKGYVTITSGISDDWIWSAMLRAAEEMKASGVQFRCWVQRAGQEPPPPELMDDVVAINKFLRPGVWTRDSYLPTDRIPSTEVFYMPVCAFYPPGM